MKFFYITIGVIALLFIVIQTYAMSTRKDIESYPYKVIKTYDEFETREYEASLFTTVKMGTKEYKEASSQGFSVLAGYIFGGNSENKKIAMTSPVAMSLEDSMTMMFMVPKEYSRKDLPKPNKSSIEFKEEPAKKVAAIRFSGWADTEKIETYKLKLIALLDKEKIAYTNKFFFLGYNPPFDMGDRRNEIIVELQ